MSSVSPYRPSVSDDFLDPLLNLPSFTASEPSFFSFFDTLFSINQPAVDAAEPINPTHKKEYKKITDALISEIYLAAVANPKNYLKKNSLNSPNFPTKTYPLRFKYSYIRFHHNVNQLSIGYCIQKGKIGAPLRELCKHPISTEASLI